jgi:hypothetical protein
MTSLNNAVLWDVTPCDSCKNDVSKEGITFIIRVERIGELGTKLTALHTARNTLQRVSVASYCLRCS